MILRSSVAQALNREDGPRHSFQSLNAAAQHRKNNETLIFRFDAYQWQSKIHIN